MTEERLDPERLMQELTQAVHGVDAASTKLSRLTKQFQATDVDGKIKLGVGARYAIALDEELMAIADDAEKEGKRPPAEDIRAARARARLRQKDPALVADYNQTTTEMKALQTWISSQKQVISGHQTVLNGLRAMGA